MSVAKDTPVNNRREQILEIATHLFQRGFRATSLDQVAAEECRGFRITSA